MEPNGKNGLCLQKHFQDIYAQAKKGLQGVLFRKWYTQTFSLQHVCQQPGNTKAVIRHCYCTSAFAACAYVTLRHVGNAENCVQRYIRTLLDVATITTIYIYIYIFTFYLRNHHPPVNLAVVCDIMVKRKIHMWQRIAQDKHIWKQHAHIFAQPRQNIYDEHNVLIV